MKQNKSAFIRSLPLDLPAKTVVTLARKKDMVINENTVHSVRSEMRKQGGGFYSKKYNDARASEREPFNIGRAMRKEPTLGDIARAADREGKSLRIRLTPTCEEASKLFINAVKYIGIVRAREMLDQLEDQITNTGA